MQNPTITRLLCAFISILSFTTYAQTTISTVAGGMYYSTWTGDGSAATAAKIYMPTGVARDAAGNLYIADYSNSLIRKVNTSGVITTFAGNGAMGYSGDGGPATAAMISWPIGMAFDAAGNMYFSDALNAAVRKINTAGIITTVGGIAGSVAFGGDGGPATAAFMHSPHGVAADAAGNIYIADRENSRIRKINTAGIITTVAGADTVGFGGDGGPATMAKLNEPTGIAVDATGNLYIADQQNERIRKVNTAGIISTIAGTGSTGYSGDGGPATAAKLLLPFAVTLDASGNIFIADRSNCVIRKISTSGIITTVAGNGAIGYSGDGAAATAATMGFPSGVTTDGTGNIYIADTRNNRVRMVTGGVMSTIAGTGMISEGDGGPATAAYLDLPQDVVTDNTGNIYIASYESNYVRKVTPSGIISTVAGTGMPGRGAEGIAADRSPLNGPIGIAVDAAGNLYIAESNNSRVQKVNTSGIITLVAGKGQEFSYGGDGGPATAAYISAVQDIVVDPAGNIYISDNGNSRIRKINTSGIITTAAGTGVSGYSGDGGPATAATITVPVGIASDASGNIYFADLTNYAIRRIDVSGTITTVAGTGVAGHTGDGGPATAAMLQFPISVGVDFAGNVYIADGLDNMVRTVNHYGVIGTAAGNGTAGYSGDGGPATAAQFSGCATAVPDMYGNIFICDGNNNAVRRVTASPTLNVTNAAGTGEYNIFPNPANTDMTITGSRTINHVRIINMLGQAVHDGEYSAGTVKVNVSSLPSGIYFVQVNDGYRQKVLKE